jgi:hypothetical protein
VIKEQFPELKIERPAIMNSDDITTRASSISASKESIILELKSVVETWKNGYASNNT